nr:MAG TPA: hypothetical protein [Caudoviricetes sp.]
MTTQRSPPGLSLRTPHRSTGGPLTPGFLSCRCRASGTSQT